MNSDANETFQNIVKTLSEPESLRVWSVIVTVFGDLAQGPKDQISGGTLGRIMHPMGLKPDAIRVALHRLRNDGWIESARVGRTSVHQLTAMGRSESAAVTPLIYDRLPKSPYDWQIVVAGGAAGLAALEAMTPGPTLLNLGRGVALVAAGRHKIDPGLLVLDVTPGAVPGWVADSVFPPDLVESNESLLKALEQVSRTHLDTHALSPSQTATLRTLIVHRWRRVALRTPNLPQPFLPKLWRGETCRTRVFEVLDKLPPPTLAQLDADT